MLVSLAFSIFAASAATAASPIRRLNTYNIDVPVVCFYDGTAGSSCTLSDGTTTFALPNGDVPDAPAMVVIWPHDDVTTYGSTGEDYYEGGCAEILAAISQAKFPPMEAADVNEDGSTTSNQFVAGGLLPAPAAGALAVISIYFFPIEDMVNLPNQVVTQSGNDVTVAFCQRFQLFDSEDPPSELGFRELDLSVTYNLVDTTTVSISVNDIDPTTGVFDLGDYCIKTELCDDTGPGSSGNVLQQGEGAEFCVVPLKYTGSTTGETCIDNGSATTDIIIVQIDEFDLFYDTDNNILHDSGEPIQDVYDGGVKAPETTVAAADGNACAEGLGDDSEPAVHGCQFTTVLDSSFYGPDGAGATPTPSPVPVVLGTGSVTVQFRDGSRRKLQAFDAGETAEISTSATLNLATSADDTSDDRCSDWFILFRWICEIWFWIVDLFD